MRRFAARLLTAFLRPFRAAFTRIVNRRKRRSAQRDLRSRLLLSPMESREHPGDLAGGVVLAAFGYEFTDPLHGLALAFGDLAFMSGSRASAMPPAVFTGVWSNPQPVTSWLPPQGPERLRAEDERSSRTPSAISVSAARPSPKMGVELDGPDSASQLPSRNLRIDADGPLGSFAAPATQDGGGGGHLNTAGSRGESDWSGGGGAAMASGAESAMSVIPDAAIPDRDANIEVTGGHPSSKGGGTAALLTGGNPPAPLAGFGGGLKSPPSAGLGSFGGASQPKGPNGGSGFQPMGPVPGGPEGSSAGDAHTLPLVLITAPDPAAGSLEPSTGVVRFAYVGPASADLTVYFRVSSDLIHAAYYDQKYEEEWHYGTSGNLQNDYWIDSETEELFGRITFASSTRTAFVWVTGDPELAGQLEGLVSVEIVPARNPLTWEELPENAEQPYSIDSLDSASVVINGGGGGHWPVGPQNGPVPSAVGITGIDAHLSEAGPSNASYEISRAGSTSKSLDFYYRVMSKSTASLESDFTVPGASVVDTWVGSTIPAGKRSVSLRVDPIDDGELEGDEVVWVEVTVGTGQVGDRVWYDWDGDGIQDKGEPGVAGHAVRLKDDATGDTYDTTTDGNGIYLFTDVAPGPYTVGFGILSNYDFTIADAGDDGLDSDVVYAPNPPDGYGWTASFEVLGTGPGIDYMDAGLVTRRTNAIGDFTWVDFDRDGIHDESEPPLGGVLVTLFTPANVPVATQATDGEGQYLFAGIPAGTYYLHFEPPSGYAAAFSTGAFGVEPSTVNLDYDAGFYPVEEEEGSASGTVYIDENANGSQDAGEDGLDGATVGVTNENGIPIGDPSTTAPDGSFRIEGLDPGWFRIQIDWPVGFLPLEQPPEPFWVYGGTETSGLNAGAYLPASIAGTVFADTANLTVHDAGEGGVGGVDVTLVQDVGGGLWVPVGHTSTAADGTFSFLALVPGTYHVLFTAPAGAAFTTPNASGTSGTFAAVSGSTFTGVDAGLATVIAGAVTEDDNGDGIQSPGVTGVTGATVILEQYDSGTSTWVAVGDPFVTGASGLYEFVTPEPGDYQVQISAPSGFSFSPQGQGDDPSSDSDFDPLTGESPTITIGTTGFGHTHLDAGLFQLGTLDGIVWHDENGDGILNGSGAGEGGVAVELLDAAGTVIDATVTAVDGTYDFVNVTPGDYVVSFALSSGFVFTHASQGTDAALDSDVAPDGVTGLVAVASGQVTAGVYAGVVEPVEVSGLVFGDATPDGINDGEDGLAGVTITLLGATGTPLGPTTVTDSNGGFSFVGLVPATYGVRIEPAEGDRVSPWSTGSGSNVGSDADPTTGVTLLAAVEPGQTLTFNAGVYTPFGGGIGGRVVDDPDRNGLLPIAPGIDPLVGVAGVVVELLDAETSAVLLSTVTGPDGGYVFPVLAADTYVVRIAPPGLLGPRDVGNDAYDRGDSDFDPVAATTAPLAVTTAFRDAVDAAIDSTQEPGSVGGRVWEEAGAANGVQDSGEDGRPGVVVELLRDGEAIFETLTDATGFYSFGYIVPGSGYAVRFAAPEDAAFSPQDVGDDATDSDPDPVSGTTATFAVAAGASADRDAGLVLLDPDLGAITGIAWTDADGDGIRNGAYGLQAGVPVDLHTVTGTFVDSTVTGIGGGYQFLNIPEGDYRVTFTPPTGFVLSPQHQGSDPTSDSDPDPATEETDVLSVGSGETLTSIDAGLVDTESGGGGEGEGMMGGGWGGANFGMGMESGSSSSPPTITHPAASVTIHDDDSILVVSTTNLSPAPTIAAVAGGTLGTTTVASFVDADPLRTFLDYTATIDWGEGGPTAATVTEDFEVQGVPPYTRPGSYGITVVVNALYREDPYDSKHVSPVVFAREVRTHLTAVIDAPEVVFLESPALEAELPDAVPAGTLAVFEIDPTYEDYEPFGYEADVYFGDGSEPVTMAVEAGELNGEPVYNVISTGHTYEHAGSYTVRVVIRDLGSNLQPGGVPVGRTDGTAEIAPDGADTLDATSDPDTDSERVEPFEYELGEVTLADLENSAVTIDWGDGSPRADADLTETAPNSDTYAIAGKHAYRGAGVYGVTFTVSVDDIEIGTRGTTLVIEEENVSATGPAELDLPVEERGGTFRIAAFASDEASDASDEYSAWITWGDHEETEPGEVAGAAARVFGSGGEFWIGVDPHTFPGSGVYTAVVRIWEAGAPWAVWEQRTELSVNVGLEHEASPSGDALGVMRLEPADSFDDLRVWVDLGDLTPDDEPVLTLTEYQPAGVGKQPPAAPGHPMQVQYYTIAAPIVAYDLPDEYSQYFEADKAQHSDGAERSVVIADLPLAGEIVERAIVEQPQPLSGLSVMAGFATGDVTVVQFADPDPQPWGEGEETGTLSDWYEATIDWGDGTTDPGVLVAGGVGTLVTSDGHIYADGGTYVVSIFVVDLEPFGGVSHSTALVQFPLDVAPAQFDAYQRRNERDESLWLPAGAAGAVSPNTGAVLLSHALDFDVSPGTAVGLDPHLVYNSDTVEPRPVIEAVVPTGATTVDRIEATLTWDDEELDAVTFTPGAGASGPNWLVAARPDATDIATGVYAWTLDIAVYETGTSTPTIEYSKTGWAQVVNATESPFGAGWNLDTVWRVIPDADDEGGLQLVYGTGASRYFPKEGSRFVRPPEEHGTLKPKDGGYEYRDPSGLVRRFDSAGRQTAVVDRNGLSTDFTWATDRLSTIVAIDGQTVAIDYDQPVIEDPTASEVVISESDGRLVVVRIADGNAVHIADPGGTLRAFEYDGHRVSRDEWGGRIAEYGWGPAGHDTDDLGDGFELGSVSGSAYDLVPAAARGLWGSTSATPSFDDAFSGRIVDPRANPTAHVVDPLGRVLKTTYADDTFETTIRDAAGHVDRFTDARGFTTDTDRDRRGNVVRIAYPDGGSASFAYDAFSQVTARSDSFEHVTRYSYDAKGNLLSIRDPNLNATTYTYYSGPLVGLVESITDARGYTTGFEYDSHRRLELCRAELWSQLLPNSGCRDLGRFAGRFPNCCAFWRRHPNGKRSAPFLRSRSHGGRQWEASYSRSAAPRCERWAWYWSSQASSCATAERKS